MFAAFPAAALPAAAPAKSVDWRASGKVTRVGSQGGW